MLRLVVVTLALFLAAPAFAQHHDQPRPHTVTVRGEGEAERAPDHAVVRLSIVTEGQEPEATRADNAKASADAVNAVRELGIPEEQIQLETLRLQPRYDYRNGNRRLLGYQATRSLSVEVRDLEKLPAVVARVVQGGANQLQGVSYGLRDQTDARAEALRDAAEDARTKAQILAQTLGASLGRVMTIDETGFRVPQPPMPYQSFARAESADVAQPEPDAYAAGQITIGANVQVTFLLE